MIAHIRLFEKRKIHTAITAMGVEMWVGGKVVVFAVLQDKETIRTQEILLKD